MNFNITLFNYTVKVGYPYINVDGNVFNSKRKKILKDFSNGGARVKLSDEKGRRLGFPVWYLMATTYLNYKQNNQEVVFVIDGNLKNTKLSNLRLIEKSNLGVEITGHKDYFIKEDAKVYSCKHGRVIELKTSIDSRGRYIQVNLGGTSKLLHRLVAETFIPNPENKPEIDYIDRNTFNNSVQNLRRVTRQENMSYMLENSSPIRYFKECILISEDEFFAKEFKSIASACRYASENFNCSYSMLNKHHEHNGYKIIKKPQTTIP